MYGHHGVGVVVAQRAPMKIGVRRLAPPSLSMVKSIIALDASQPFPAIFLDLIRVTIWTDKRASLFPAG